MTPYIERHYPLIASRIEFNPAPPLPLPLITPRIEFTAEQLARIVEGGEGRALGRLPRSEPNETESSTGGESSGSSSARNLPNASAGKIPKPPGEPGRPGSGGYCMDTELVNTHNWSKESVLKLTNAVRAEARKQLDMTTSFRSQNKATIQKICDKARTMMEENNWPLLKNYDGCWPVHSILKLALKYGAEASRRANVKDSNRRLRAALRGSSPEA